MAKRAQKSAEPADDDLESDDKAVSQTDDAHDDPPAEDATPLESQEEGASDEGGSDAAAGDNAAQPTIRDFLREQNLTQFADMEDDRSAVAAILANAQQLANQAQRASEQERLLTLYQQQLQQFQQQSQQAAQAQQQAAAQPKPKWEAPEFNPKWVDMVEKDANGNLIAKPGADLTLPQKIGTYLDWRREQEHKFWTNPHQFVMEGIQEQLDQLVDRRLQQSLGGYQAQQSVQQLVDGARPWMFQHTAEGQQVLGAGGQPIFTAEGQAFAGYVREAARMGVSGDMAQWNYATTALQRDIAQRAVQAGQAKTPAEKQKQSNKKFLDATRNPSKSGAKPQPQFNGKPAQTGTMLSFAERAAHNAREAGLLVED